MARCSCLIRWKREVDCLSELDLGDDGAVLVVLVSYPAEPAAPLFRGDECNRSQKEYLFLILRAEVLKVLGIIPPSVSWRSFAIFFLENIRKQDLKHSFERLDDSLKIREILSH